MPQSMGAFTKLYYSKNNFSSARTLFFSDLMSIEKQTASMSICESGAGQKYCCRCELNAHANSD